MFSQIIKFRRLITSWSSLTSHFHRPQNCPKIASCGANFFIPIRLKYQNTSGIKGTKARKFKVENDDQENEILNENNEEYDLEEDRDYDTLANAAMHVTKNILNIQNVFIIQPYVKWGPSKSATSPDLKLEEAEALVRSIPTWSIGLSITVPLDSLNKKSIFGTGKLTELKDTIRKMKNSAKPVTCVFISKGTLTAMQKQNLEFYFGVPVMDRYSVVIQILRLHATSMEAKLQVAMAEIPYIWTQLRDTEGIPIKGGAAYTLNDTQKMLLRRRERKLKEKLTDLREHRELLRNKRKQKDFPVVAIVGYTNCGKTSLIKALTNEESLQPRNQLFATLDVTAHAGILPCRLKVIFMDTVGFMSDIPTGLIECFVATLEDAMLADIIVHVQDISHNNHLEQCKHVEETLKSLWHQNSKDLPKDFLIENLIHVGNKCDLIDTAQRAKFTDANLKLISAKTQSGCNDLLLEIERKILQVTNRQKMIIKVPMGGQESAWLYKNAAVTDSNADPENSQKLLLSVVISMAKLQQFRHYFLSK